MKKNELEAWWATLPEEVRGGRSQSEAQFRSAMHNQLEYCLLRMFIGRPFLLGRNIPGPEPNSSESSREGKSSTDGIQKRNADRQHLVECCIRTAKEALDICKSLRDNGPGLARASYIEYSSCRAALLVLIAYSIQNQTNPFRQHLRGGLDMIREMSTSGDSARSEVRLIETLESALVRLHLFNTQRHGEGETTSLAQGGSASGYENLKQWESLWKGQNHTSRGDLCDYSKLLAPHRSASARQDHHHATSGEPPLGPMMGMLNNSRDGAALTVPTGKDDNLNPLRPFYSAAELALFGGRDTATFHATMHPEAQVLDQFVSMPDPSLFAGHGNQLGSMGSANPDAETLFRHETLGG